MKTTLLIDGNAIMHRAFHALPPFKTSTNIPTGAVYGFLSMLNKSITDFKPTNVIVLFDTPVKTFRKKMYEKYQAQRPSMDDDLKVQFPNIKEGLDAAGIVHVEKEGFEADDLIGTLSHRLAGKNSRVLIISGDRDILQLVDKNILAVTPQIGFSNIKIYDEGGVIEKFGIKPNQIPDFKALAGDPSDNYSGAKGIGPKTAAKLISEFGTVENLYKKIDKVESEKIRSILKSDKKHILLSKKLATIVKDVSIDFAEDKSHFTFFNEDLKDYLKKYQMSSLIKRFFAGNKPEEPKKEEKKEKQIGLF